MWDGTHKNDFNDEPVCPHCGVADQDWCDGLTVDVHDDAKWVASCGNCGKDYEVTANVTTTFSTKIAAAPQPAQEPTP